MVVCSTPGSFARRRCQPSKPTWSASLWPGPWACCSIHKVSVVLQVCLSLTGLVCAETAIMSLPNLVLCVHVNAGVWCLVLDACVYHINHVLFIVIQWTCLPWRSTWKKAKASASGKPVHLSAFLLFLRLRCCLLLLRPLLLLLLPNPCVFAVLLMTMRMMIWRRIRPPAPPVPLPSPTAVSEH